MTKDWKSLYQQNETDFLDDSQDYTDIAMDHFSNPRNVGRIEAYHGMGQYGDPSCGDYLEMTLKIDENDTITDIGFLVYGCAGAIASSSMVGELVKGKNFRYALRLTDQDVIKALGGLPDVKQHCSLLGLEALRMAIADALYGRKLIQDKKITDYNEYRRLRQEGKIRFEFRT